MTITPETPIARMERLRIAARNDLCAVLPRTIGDDLLAIERERCSGRFEATLRKVLDAIGKHAETIRAPMMGRVDDALLARRDALAALALLADDLTDCVAEVDEHYAERLDDIARGVAE